MAECPPGLSADGGFKGCPGVLHQRRREPCWHEAPPASSEACERLAGGFLPEAHTLFSAQLAKFSEDTLSSYTEAVSSQVRSPRMDSAPGPVPPARAPSGPCWNAGTSLLYGL